MFQTRDNLNFLSGKKKEFRLHESIELKLGKKSSYITIKTLKCLTVKNIKGRDNLRFEFERKKVKTVELYFLLSVRVIQRVFLLWFPVWRQEDPVCEAAASLTEAQGHGHAPEVVTINSWICFQSKYK